MSTEDPPCGLDAAIAVMGGKWKPLILYHLNSGPQRFGDLQRLVVGEIMLSRSPERVASASNSADLGRSTTS